MSHTSPRPGLSTTAEASLLTALNNLTAGGVGTAIQKTTSTTFSNVNVSASGGMAIGGSITSATQGSILFAGAAGVLAQDNAQLFWDDTNHWLGIGTAVPTNSITVASTGNGIAIYNTTDQTSVFTKLTIGFISGTATITPVWGSGASSSNLVLATGSGNSQTTGNHRLTISQGGTPVFKLAVGGTDSAATIVEVGMTSGGLGAASGNQTMLLLDAAIAQSSTAGYTALLINPTETSTGTGLKLLTDWQVGSSSLLSVNDTGQLVQHSTASAQGVALYNTSDEVTNFEKGLLSWSSNVLTLATSKGGTGTGRTISINAALDVNLFSGANDAFFKLSDTANTTFNFNKTTAGTQGNLMLIIGGMNASTGVQVGFSTAFSVAQTGSAGYTAFQVQPNESTTGSGTKLLMQLGTALSPNLFTVNNVGHVTVEGVTSTGATGTGAFVFATTPTLVTPVLGVATATSINKVAFTAPASGSTLTIADGKTLTVSQTMTLTSSGTSSVITFPNATDTVGGLGTAQTWTAQNKFNNFIEVNNAITAVSNAATVPVAFRLSTVTNNSAAGLAITITTTSAVDGQMLVVRVLDSSAVAQAITWTNTENSTVTAPTTSNGSTTLPLTVGFQYNGGTSKWRCIASA